MRRTPHARARASSHLSLAAIDGGIPEQRIDARTSVAVDRAVEMRARRTPEFVAIYLQCADAPEHVIERVLDGAQARRQP